MADVPEKQTRSAGFYVGWVLFSYVVSFPLVYFFSGLLSGLGLLSTRAIDFLRWFYWPLTSLIDLLGMHDAVHWLLKTLTETLPFP